MAGQLISVEGGGTGHVTEGESTVHKKGEYVKWIGAYISSWHTAVRYTLFNTSGS